MLETTTFEEKITKNRNDRIIKLYVVTDNSTKEMRAVLQLYDMHSKKITDRIQLTEQEMFEMLLVLNAYFEA